MSETDDTEELLSVTPHVEDSIPLEESFSPYFHIVDKLISQVYKLKHKISNIERFNSDASVGSISNDKEFNMSEPLNCRRCTSLESLPLKFDNKPNQLLPSSAQSTPQKPRSKLMLRNPTNVEQLERNEAVGQPISNLSLPQNRLRIPARSDNPNSIGENKEDDILSEIDTLLANVKKVVKKPDISRNLTRDFERINTTYNERKNKVLDEVKQILKEMDDQQIKINHVYDNKFSEHISKFHAIIANTDTECDRADPPINDQHEPDLYISKKHERTPPKLRMDDSSPPLVAKPITDIFRSEIHSAAQETLNLHKKLLNRSHNSTESPDNYQSKKSLGYFPTSHSSLGALSLVDLWNTNYNEINQNPDKYLQKLHEEKLRRAHCEELIQQLQNKILEQQEKLSVAIQVDEAKDSAMIKFHDAWEKVSIRLKVVMKENEVLEKEREKLFVQNKQIGQDYEEKVEFYKKETGKALKLSEETQERVCELEEKLSELKQLYDTNEKKLRKLTDDYNSETEKNRQLSDILANKEIELSETKNILIHAKNEVTQSKTAIETCQKDFTTIKQEYEQLQESFENERSNAMQLREQNKFLYEEIERHKQNEEILEKKLDESKGNIERNKVELKSFYQGQVELLVQNKLKEFQKQLEDAEKNMKEEMDKRELEIAKQAAFHIQQITDKHSLEINLLEQKHHEELQLQKVKYAHAEQQLLEAQSKLDRQQQRRTQLAFQLQKVMEAQWAEAMKIINSKSPTSLHDSSASTIDQLHSLQSKSYLNVESLLADEEDADRSDSKVPRSPRKIVAKNKNAKSLNENDLHRYINMLLQKQPNYHSVPTKDVSLPGNGEQPTLDAAHSKRSGRNK